MNKKVGRPLIYIDDDSRKEAKRNQDRKNQKKCRERKNRKKPILEFCGNKNREWNKQYQDNLIEFFSVFNYDYYFTGTVALNDRDRNELRIINDEIRLLNNYLGTDFGYKIGKKTGIRSLERYTEQYVDFLIKNGAIDRCFWVIETGKFNNYHIHMILKLRYDSLEFAKQFESKWLMGKSLIEPIIGDDGFANVIEYMVKELIATSQKENDKIKIDNWNFAGDFETCNTASMEE
jgi:hypothetical protein